MGLDVGIVNIKYLKQPDEPVRGFLFDLAGDDFTGWWGGGWEGNAFLEIYRDALERKARDYASRQGLSRKDVEKLVSWVWGLPGDVVMLHMGW